MADREITDRDHGTKPETDVEADPSTARSRDEGEVGRVAGQDEGYAGETGAERRAEAARKEGDGG